MSNGQLPKHILPKYAILGYPQSDVSFQIDVQAKTLFLTDLCEQGRSLTNDMKNALCRIIHSQRVQNQPIRLDEFTIFYSDSDNDVCGVECYRDAFGGIAYRFYPVLLPDLNPLK